MSKQCHICIFSHDDITWLIISWQECEIMVSKWGDFFQSAISVLCLCTCPYSETSLQGTLQYPRQVSIHDRCPYMTGVHTWWVSRHNRCPYITGVHTWWASRHCSFLNMGQIRHCYVSYSEGVLWLECPLETALTAHKFQPPPGPSMSLEDGGLPQCVLKGLEGGRYWIYYWIHKWFLFVILCVKYYLTR